ncbi:hypothetical protein KEJ21_06980 [Candidatus Bathyarchaeota archaeon]|nr:hypothetical protein [Candidatus Bathyarchaeota archaeon]MBS7631263.1 hypothetical protein [Candidatus Bathyarchaeota archaeon]
MAMEVKPDKEAILIDKLARKIVESGMEGPAITILQIIKPVSVIGGELAYFYLAPFLPLLDDYGYDFLDIFEKRENIEKLIKKVEKLYNEQAKNKKEKDSIINRLKKLFWHN